MIILITILGLFLIAVASYFVVQLIISDLCNREASIKETYTKRIVKLDQLNEKYNYLKKKLGTDREGFNEVYEQSNVQIDILRAKIARANISEEDITVLNNLSTIIYDLNKSIKVWENKIEIAKKQSIGE
jgi:tRNA C32,U32 (ribose-2'-O)-methylase TrmJ